MKDKKVFINLGCGTHFHEDWVNIDFSVTGKDVISHNLNEGIPFPSDFFEVVYSSHVIEHFTKKDAMNFLSECFRVLKNDGILRIVFPDLEGIIIEYQKHLSLAINGDKKSAMNYDWIMLELFDQTVRNYSGGNMAEYIYQEELKNEDYVFQRIGHEGKELRKRYFAGKAITKAKNDNKRGVYGRIKFAIKIFLIELIFKEKYELIEKYLRIGKFRQSGEIHQWMYDRYSLALLLKQIGFKNIEIKTAFGSKIPDFSRYNLDVINGEIRKPDSLYIEANK